MRHPQIVVYETDGRLAQQLTALADAKRWLLRQVRQTPACIAFLRRHAPTVFVLKAGRDLKREITLLKDVAAQTADLPIVVVGDADDAMLQALEYDLGATFVLQPPLERQRLPELVEQMMQSAIAAMAHRPYFPQSDEEDSDSDVSA